MQLNLHLTDTFSFLQTGMSDTKARQIVLALIVAQEILDIPVFDNMERFSKDEIENMKSDP